MNTANMAPTRRNPPTTPPAIPPIAALESPDEDFWGGAELEELVEVDVEVEVVDLEVVVVLLVEVIVYKIRTHYSCPE